MAPNSLRCADGAVKHLLTHTHVTHLKNKLKHSSVLHIASDCGASPVTVCLLYNYARNYCYYYWQGLLLKHTDVLTCSNATSLHDHHHHHHHQADIYNAPITTKQEHRCSTKIQIVVDETYWMLKAILKR